MLENTKSHDFLVFIGRFQPLHNGHMEVIKEAIKNAHYVIILVGSANLSRSPRNPFTASERINTIKIALTQEYGRSMEDHVYILPIDDYDYSDELWQSNVQRVVRGITHKWHDKVAFQNNPRIGLIGHEKDGTSFYLKMFPMWSSMGVKNYHNGLSSTTIRAKFYAGRLAVDYLPRATRKFLIQFMGIRVEEYKSLVDWYLYDQKYNPKEFPVIVVCVDSIVIQGGHVLLVRRKNHPGMGLLALPGGHVDQTEYLEDAAVRELKEETRISDDRGEIPPAMLKSFIVDNRLFDAPHRSSRCRVITQAYLFKLPDRTKLFSVLGDDDAESAQWYEIGNLDPREFFEDHYFIMQNMMGRV